MGYAGLQHQVGSKLHELQNQNYEATAATNQMGELVEELEEQIRMALHEMSEEAFLISRDLDSRVEQLAVKCYVPEESRIFF